MDDLYVVMHWDGFSASIVRQDLVCLHARFRETENGRHNKIQCSKNEKKERVDMWRIKIIIY